MKKLFLLLLFPFLLYAKLDITVAFPLEAFFIQKIVQGNARVKTISNRYITSIAKLRKSDYNKLAQSDIFFYFNLPNSKEYLKILKKYNKNIKIFNLSQNTEKINFKNDVNPYVWMDPLNVRIVLINIYNELVKYDRKNKFIYKSNLDVLLKEIDQIFLKVKKQFFLSPKYNFIVYDEYWQYFSHRFKLSLHYKDKRLLRASEINPLNDLVKENDIEKMIISKDDSLIITKSISGNADLKVITSDIFYQFWFMTINQFTNDLKK